MSEHWEYTGLLLSTFGGDNIEKLTSMGKDGWELVAVDSGIAYMKRRLEPAQPAAKPEKPKAVLVGVLGAGPLFADADERRRERWYNNRRAR